MRNKDNEVKQLVQNHTISVRVSIQYNHQVTKLPTIPTQKSILFPILIFSL